MTRPALALIEPDIPGNVGAILRTCACLGVEVHLVEPCGFAFSDKALRRAGMDYAASARLIRHADRATFVQAMRDAGRRILLLTTAGDSLCHKTHFLPHDVLLMGSESRGAPADIHEAADLLVRIALMPGYRSLNVGVSAGIALAEALRQTGGLPE